jgi:putative NADH-flavin reductase
MKIAILGSTGAVGRECLEQSLEAGHQVKVLVRTASKLPPELRERITVIEGDALNEDDVSTLLDGGVEAVLFAIGIDKHSPEGLCTDVTRHLLATMPRLGVRRLVWCGGGSTIVDGDQVTFGAKFVEFFARTFMGLRHRDKTHQFELLDSNRDIEWLGVRPLQINRGRRRGEYRLGFDAYSGFSSISFADCADAMLGMLTDSTWLYKAPIIQY